MINSIKDYVFFYTVIYQYSKYYKTMITEDIYVL